MSPSKSTTSTHTHDSAFAAAVTKFCIAGHAPPTTAVKNSFLTLRQWKAMGEAGTELWLDTGDVEAIKKSWTREFTALTTNNTLLNNEVQKGIYDTLVPRAAKAVRAAEPEISDEELVLEIAFVLNAAHGLKLVRTFDCDVSVELHTALSRNTDASYEYGKRFHAVCPDRFIVKVPLTPEGIFAARRLILDGIRVNFTLGFSARQNNLVGLVARPSFVNVFMGRLNAFVAKHDLGDGLNVGEKATLASQRMLRILNEKQGTAVRQIGASIRSGIQCRDLTGLDVLTIPTSAADEYVALKIPSKKVLDVTGEDPEVVLKNGVEPEDLKLDVLWNTGGALPGAMELLSKENLDEMNGDQLREFLGRNGMGDLFPTLSESDRKRVTADGKIPNFKRWKDRVAAGDVSWDGIFTESALSSFATDQAALDDRIRKFL